MGLRQELLDRLAVITPEEERLRQGNPVSRSDYTDSVGFTVDIAKCVAQGEQIGIRPHTRFAAFPRHAHNYIEMIYMCQGQTVHLINDTDRVVLRAGEVLLLNQHAVHAIERAGLTDLAVNFMMLPPFFDGALEWIGTDNPLGQFLISSLRRADDRIDYLHFQVADSLPVQNLLENMVWSMLENRPNERGILQKTMRLLLLQLLNDTSHLLVPPSRDNSHVLVLAVLREIQENYPAAELGKLAGRYGVSLSYLSGLVRTATGYNFQQLLQNRRLEQAGFLLASTKLPVQDVIAAVGYENTSYFHRLFSARYGMTPKQYRQAQTAQTAHPDDL